MFDLYQQQILERYKNPRHAGKLAAPTNQADGANYVCGDEVHWEISLNEQGSVAEAVHTTRACAVCSASADLLAEEITGKAAAEIEKFSPEKITEMLGIPLSPTRLKCALLPLETLKDALKQTQV